MSSAIDSWNATPLVTRSPVTTTASAFSAFARSIQRFPHHGGVSAPMWRSERWTMR